MIQYFVPYCSFSLVPLLLKPENLWDTQLRTDPNQCKASLSFQWALFKTLIVEKKIFLSRIILIQHEFLSWKRGIIVFSKITSNKPLFLNVVTSMTEIRLFYNCNYFPLLLAMDKGICSVCCDANAPVWETREDNSRCRKQTRMPQWWVSMVVSVNGDGSTLLHAQIKSYVHYVMESSFEGLWASSNREAVTLVFGLSIKNKFKKTQRICDSW